MKEFALQSFSVSASEITPLALFSYMLRTSKLSCFIKDLIKVFLSLLEDEYRIN